MQLEEQFYELDRAKLKRWLPWLHLFRAFRLAISPKAILLGCLAVLLVDYALQTVEKLPFAKGSPSYVPAARMTLPAADSNAAAELAEPTDPDRRRRVSLDGIRALSLDWEKTYAAPFETVAGAFSHGWLVLHPVTQHLPFARQLVRNGGWTGGATAVTGLLACLLVWSICGVGVARLAAVRFAADETVSLRGTLRFSLRKVSPSLGSAVVPMVGVLLLWFAGVVLGWLAHIPGVGGVLVAVGWGLALIGGLLMALILLGLAAGWPLMLASVAVEDADSFDAFSRIYNYLFSRPWYSLSLVLLALLYGSVLIVFTCTLLNATHTLTDWAVAGGLGQADLMTVMNAEPGEVPFAVQGVSFWKQSTELVFTGYLVSYFWTAATIIYFLLRKSVDATPLDAVTILPTDTPGDDLPLVGMPAAEKREAMSE